MARSDVETWNLLNRYPHVFYDNPWHFNQISGKGAPLNDSGDEVYVQWERDDIANAINTAAWLMIDGLGFFPRPTWYTEEVTLGHGEPYEWVPLRTTYGYLSEFSVRTKALIEADVEITYSDADGDGINDTATMSVTTDIDTDDIRVYFRTADGADSASDDDWEIEPLTLSATGGVVTIAGPRYLFAHPDNVWGVPYVGPNFTTKNNGNTEIDSHFVEYVDVYRVYGATGTAVGVVSDPIFSGATTLDSNDVSYGVARITNARLGHFEARLTCGTTTYPFPEKVQISYKSGYALRNNKMEQRLETNILRLANTLMPYQPRGLKNHPGIQRWKDDTIAVSELQSFTGRTPPPWGGAYHGEWRAWAGVSHMAIAQGSKVTRRSR